MKDITTSSAIVLVVITVVLLLLISLILSLLKVSNNNLVRSNIILTSENENHFIEYNNSDHILNKNVYSNYSRLLLVAGINIIN